MGPRLVHTKILVVEDYDDARLILELALRGLGAEVCTAANASEATQVLAHFRPDVLVLDISLPDEDGIALLARIRRDEGMRGIPAVAYTAHGSAFDRARTLRAGFEEHVGKPSTIDAVAHAIARALGRGKERTEVRETTPSDVG